MLKIALASENRERADWVMRVAEQVLGYARRVWPVQLNETYVPGEEDCLVVHLDQEKLTMDSLAALQKNFPEQSLIILTDRLEDVLELHKVNYLAMVVGPNTERLSKALAAAQTIKDDTEERTLMVTWKNTSRFVPLKDIVMIERDLRRTDVKLAGGDVLTTYQTMDDLIAQLDDDFVRVHFSCVVNSRYMARTERGCVILNNGEYVPVSRSYSKHLSEYLAGKV